MAVCAVYINYEIITEFFGATTGASTLERSLTAVSNTCPPGKFVDKVYVITCESLAASTSTAASVLKAVTDRNSNTKNTRIPLQGCVCGTGIIPYDVMIQTFKLFSNYPQIYYQIPSGEVPVDYVPRQIRLTPSHKIVGAFRPTTDPLYFIVAQNECSLAFGEAIDVFQDLKSTLIVSAHLPVAQINQLLDSNRQYSMVVYTAYMQYHDKYSFANTTIGRYVMALHTIAVANKVAVVTSMDLFDVLKKQVFDARHVSCVSEIYLDDQSVCVATKPALMPTKTVGIVTQPITIESKLMMNAADDDRGPARSLGAADGNGRRSVVAAADIVNLPRVLTSKQIFDS